MTYIEYLNQFDRWLEQADSITDKSVVLYYALLSMFNRRGWPVWAGVDTHRLMMMARTTSKATAVRARDSLVSYGLIEYKKGRKGKSTEYRLCEIRFYNWTENDTKNDTENCTENDTKNDTPNKTKTKNNIPPYNPPKGESGRFEEFWAIYPNRKCGKSNALKSWKKIKHTPELDDIILAAVAKQKEWPDWKKDGGQYIPMATTWLNQRRWDAEPQERRDDLDFWDRV